MNHHGLSDLSIKCQWACKSLFFMDLKVMSRINKLIPLLADILTYSLSSEFSEDHVHIMDVNYL